MSVATPTETVGGAASSPLRGGFARSGLLVAAFAAVALWPLLAGDAFWLRKLFLVALLSIVAIGFNLVLGYAGEYALGQIGIFAVGAYVAGSLSVTYGVDGWLAIALACAAAGLVGVVAGFPGLRVGGWYFALTSLFIATVIPQVARLMPDVTGGEFGLAGIPPLSLGGRELTLEETYLIVLALLAGCVVLMRNLTRSPWGLAFAALRRSDVCLAATGVAPVRVKLVTYLLAALMAGLAGAFFPQLNGFVSPDSFPLSLSILLIGATIVGGSGVVWAPIVGVAVLQVIPDLASDFERYALLVYGATLVVATLLIPDGIVPLVRDRVAQALERLAPDRPAPVPATSAADADRVAATARASERVRAATSAAAALEVDGVTKAFGGMRALDAVTLRAAPGEITALIGPNGSGKTTLLNTVTGFYRADGGSVAAGGERIDRLAPQRVVRRGVARTFQTPLLLDDRSARDNVVAGLLASRRAGTVASALRTPSARGDAREFARAAEDLLALVGLAAHADALAGTLPPGRQRLLEIARALAARPSVLLLDEPAAGLVGDEIDALDALLRTLRELGLTVVLVEHNMPLVMGLADHVVVLDSGELLAQGTPAQVRGDARVVASYLGEARA